ncbi:MAG: hypothetical protein JOZ69_06355, partial [Myxococcales bacterium]|nr:hypothetical protein [Myxococcales bacterium]
GMVRAGARYFYCDAFGLMAYDPCLLGAAHDEPPCPLQALGPEPGDCCRRITMPAMPDGARSSEVTIAPASVVSVMPVTDYAIAGAGALTRRGLPGVHRLRWPPLPGGTWRAQLMVSLT